MLNNSLVTEIENEYRRIDSKWLQMHFKTSVGLVLVGILLESILGIVIYSSGDVKLPLSAYVAKYILAPTAINFIVISLDFWAMRNIKISKNFRVYIISLSFVVICFAFYAVHSIFKSLYLILILPILLTVVYGNYKLTTVTALFSLTARIIADLFVRWDPEQPNVLSSFFSSVDFLISNAILIIFFFVCLIVIRYEREKNDASIQKEIERHKLQQKLKTDELTSVFNRTGLRTALQSMEEDRASNSYIFVMIDLDNFKQLNDTLGHLIGDQCLMEFGSLLKANCGDAAAFRFGGDEFCLLFKNVPMDSVIDICKKIQTDYKEAAEAITTAIPLTVSFGVAALAENMTAAQLLKETDRALYYSKEQKNSINVYSGNNDKHSQQFKN